MLDLAGKVALVTGGSKGIGRAISSSLGAAGADVLLCARNAAEAERGAEEIAEAGGGRVLGLAVDVRRLEDVKRLVERAVKEFGGVDILIANAGVGGGFGPVDEIDPEAWHRVIDTNLTGVYYCCHEAVPEMKKRGGGWIITIGQPGRTLRLCWRDGVQRVEVRASGLHRSADARRARGRNTRELRHARLRRHLF